MVLSTTKGTGGELPRQSELLTATILCKKQEVQQK